MPVWVGRRRARQWTSAEDERQWASKWMRILVRTDELPLARNVGAFCHQGRLTPPRRDYTEFDIVVRGMLNRISTENASDLLPLEICLRAKLPATDCSSWWAGRFAALMLTSYLQVMHTNRGSRALPDRSTDNVLPQYLDAVAPLLVKSPRLVESLIAWFSRLLCWHDVCWPTSRLLLLAAREERSREGLPPYSLGRLPPELIRDRILPYLMPLKLCIAEDAADPVLAHLCYGWSTEEGQKDVLAVFAHFLAFMPPALWPQFSHSAVALAEAALIGPLVHSAETRIYLSASVLATAMRWLRQHVKVDWQAARMKGELGPLIRLADRLEQSVLTVNPEELSDFARSRARDALDQSLLARESLPT